MFLQYHKEIFSASMLFLDILQNFFSLKIKFPETLFRQRPTFCNATLSGISKMFVRGFQNGLKEVCLAAFGRCKQLLLRKANKKERKKIVYCPKLQ